MPYDVSWYIERRVVSTVLTGDLSLKDAEAASWATSQYILTGLPPLVHLIADTTHLGKFPTNLSLINGEASHHLRNPLLGWTIVISSSTATRFVSSIMTQVARVRFRMFATWEQSITFLLQQDSTLEGLVPVKKDLASSSPIIDNRFFGSECLSKTSEFDDRLATKNKHFKPKLLCEGDCTFAPVYGFAYLKQSVPYNDSQDLSE